MKVFITGGTGLIGARIAGKLQSRGDVPVILTRSPEKARSKFDSHVEIVEGDPTVAGDWMSALDACDAAINLAGENLFAKRWSDQFKEKMRESRMQGTANLVEAMARNPKTSDGRTKALINASAIGYYGAQGDQELTESSPAGSDYLAKLCADWEAEAKKAEASGIRVAVVRVGVVLDKNGGALKQLWKPFKLGVGGRVGSGKQWMSWIHHEDIVGLFCLALDQAEATGPLNGTAPNPVTNKEFTKALGRAMHRPTIFPVPKFMLRLALGEVAFVVATGQRVMPEKPIALGYQFKFPTVEEALQDIVQS